MKESTNCSILWISDIHFNHGYSNFRQFKDYFKQIFQTEKINRTIEYIIFSGDIAQSGTSEEYNAFYELIIIEVKANEYLKNAIILCIPGNHDTYIDPSNESWILDELPKSYSEKQKIDQQRKNENFKNYTKFIRERIDPLNKHILASNPGRFDHIFEENEYLYGYFIDNKFKLSFILLNSSWYSTGHEFDKKYSDLIIQRNANNPIDKIQLSNVLKTKDKIIEYNNQQIDNKLVSDLKLEENVFKKFTDHINIILCHHGPNWLHWFEKYDSDKNRNQNLALNKLFFHGHILMTGHDHVPFNVGHKRINKGAFHLESGEFLSYVKNENISSHTFKENSFWFSKIELVNSKSKLFTWTKYNIKPEYEDSGDLTVHLDEMTLDSQILKNNIPKPHKDQPELNTIHVLNLIERDLNIKAKTNDIQSGEDYFLFSNVYTKTNYYYIDSNRIDDLAKKIQALNMNSSEKNIVIMVYFEKNFHKYDCILKKYWMDQISYIKFMQDKVQIFNEFYSKLDSEFYLKKTCAINEMTDYQLIKNLSICFSFIPNFPSI